MKAIRVKSNKMSHNQILERFTEEGIEVLEFDSLEREEDSPPYIIDRLLIGLAEDLCVIVRKNDVRGIYCEIHYGNPTKQLYWPICLIEISDCEGLANPVSRYKEMVLSRLTIDETLKYLKKLLMK